MNRRSMLLASGAAAAAVAPGVALAEGEEEEGAGPRVIELSGIAAPVRRDGLLQSYVFLTLRVDIADGVDIWSMRERNHFLRDAIVRAAYRGNFTDPANPTRLVEPAATQALRAAAVEALGARAVRAVVVERVYAQGGRAAGGR